MRYRAEFAKCGHTPTSFAFFSLLSVALASIRSLSSSLSALSLCDTQETLNMCGHPSVLEFHHRPFSVCELAGTASQRCRVHCLLYLSSSSPSLFPRCHCHPLVPPHCLAASEGSYAKPTERKTSQTCNTEIISTSKAYGWSCIVTL